jgi:hypothetical protein
VQPGVVHCCQCVLWCAGLSLLVQGLSQWLYNDWLADTAGPDVPKLPAWRPAMYAANHQNKLSHPEDYRDRWVRGSNLAFTCFLLVAWFDSTVSCSGHHGAVADVRFTRLSAQGCMLWMAVLWCYVLWCYCLCAGGMMQQLQLLLQKTC